MKQNITLSVDKDLIRKLRVIAAKRSTSISRLLGQEMREIVARAERYEQAKRQAVAAIDKGFHLGGQRPSRDELHER